RQLEPVAGEPPPQFPIIVQGAMVLHDCAIALERTGVKLLPLPEHLERNVGPFVGRLQQVASTRLENPSDFRQMTVTVLDVLEQIEAQHGIEGGGLEGNSVSGGN